MKFWVGMLVWLEVEVSMGFHSIQRREEMEIYPAWSKKITRRRDGISKWEKFHHTYIYYQYSSNTVCNCNLLSGLEISLQNLGSLTLALGNIIRKASHSSRMESACLEYLDDLRTSRILDLIVDLDSRITDTRYLTWNIYHLGTWGDNLTIGDKATCQS